MSRARASLPTAVGVANPGVDYQDRGAFGPFLQGVVYASTAAGYLYLLTSIRGTPFEARYQVLAILVFVLVFAVFRRFDLLRAWRVGQVGAIGTRVVAAWALLAGVLILTGFITKQSEEFSRLVMTTWLATTPVVFLLVHSFSRHVLLRRFPTLARVRSAVVVFVNDTTGRLVELAPKLESPRLRLLGFFEDRDPERLGEMPADLPILGKVRDTATYVNRHGVEVVFVVLPAHGADRTDEVLEQLGDTTASIYYVPDVRVFDLAHMRIASLEGMPVLAVTETPFLGADGWFKRIVDLVFATGMLIALAPLMAVIAVAVKLSTGGPVFFTQRRYGLDGREIRVHKFRSMLVAEDDGDVKQASRGDPRVTRVGRILRRTSLDELPQLWNVLKGEMSVVGPRPHAVAHNEQYRKLISRYMTRHKVKPGLTGWAQVNGLRGEIRDLADMERRVVLDLEYIRNWSPELDFRIVLKTVWEVLYGQNAH